LLSWIADDDTPAGYNNANWNTAFGWGDHASGGYLTSIAANSINDTHIDWGTGSNQVSTADIPENTNLYYTDVRADARIVNAGSANWNTAYVHSQAAHAPSGAEANEYAFKTIAISGQTDVVADTTTDTLTLVGGSNMTLTTSGDTITLVAAGGGGDAFKTIAVPGQSDVVADATADTLTLAAGSNMTITTAAGTDTITFAAAGGGGNAFETIAISGQSNVVADSSTDTLTFVAGSGIALTTNAGSDSVTIAATGGAGSQNLFETISISGQTDVVADTTTDTLTLVAGSNMTLTTSFPDTITFASTGGGGGSSSFTFTVNYAAGGTSISTISNLPAGWSSSINGANVTITHTANGQPMGFSFYGLDKSASPDIWKYQYPTSTYPVTFPDASEVISTSEFTLNIGTSATGANTGTPFATSLAHIKVIF